MKWFYEYIWKDPVLSNVIAWGVPILVAFFIRKYKENKFNKHKVAIIFFVFITGILGTCFWCNYNQNYSITYHQNGGIGAKDTIYTKRSDTVLLDIKNLKREGYEFRGWYDNQNLEGDSIMSIPKGSSGDKEFWAKWILIKYIVRFDTWGGIPTIQDSTYTILSEDFILPIKVKKNGYYFKGWTLGRSTIIVDRIPKGCTGNKKFVALWEKESQKNDTVILPPIEPPASPITVTGYAKEKYSKEEAKEEAIKNALNRLREEFFPNVDISIIRRYAILGEPKTNKPYPSSDTWDATIEVSISNNIHKLD